MKKVLIASDSFKGTLSSKDIAQIARNLVERKYRGLIDLDAQLLGDGGEGTLEAIKSIKGGELLRVSTFDAEGHRVFSPLLLFEDGKSAFIEVAAAIGLPMLKGDVPPLYRSTRGLGVLIEEAIKLGAKKIYIGLGGSATNDLGIGMLQELGVDFGLGRVIGIKDALEVRGFDVGAFKSQIEGVRFLCLSDVDSPLLGESGATFVYGPQKGYGSCLPFLEERMAHLAKVIERRLGISFADAPGGGASGGLGGAFLSFFNAEMLSGSEVLLSCSGLQERIEEADLVITGEGRLDEQSLHGKLISGMLRICPKEKLLLLVGENKLKNPQLRIYETSKPNEAFQQIKLHAKEEYEAALNGILSAFLLK